jgi:tRNA(fMet)-specific endonuclease VapC
VRRWRITRRSSSSTATGRRFIDLERATRRLPAAQAMPTVGSQLEHHLGADDEVAIAAITASELLHGVHRATAEHRGRREAFVEAVLAAFPTIPFDLLLARVHARLWAALGAAGTDVRAHDRLVAATAISAGWRVGSANTQHFRRVQGLEVVEVSFG